MKHLQAGREGAAFRLRKTCRRGWEGGRLGFCWRHRAGEVAEKLAHCYLCSPVPRVCRKQLGGIKVRQDSGQEHHTMPESNSALSVSPQTWATGIGVSWIRLSCSCAHCSQGAACNEMGNEEDEVSVADEPKAFCSCCCPACTPHTQCSSAEHKEEHRATAPPRFISRCLEIAAFWSSNSNGQL